MRKLEAIALVVLLWAFAAQGQTPYTIAYTLEIGGDNHEAQYKNEENVAFTPGLPNPTTAFVGLITWDVVVAVTGSDVEGHPVQGAANLVFNLELQDEAGNPVVPAKFLSTINDGNCDSVRALNNGLCEPFERAAFCLGWDVDMDYDGVPDGNGPPFGPGRLYDPVGVGGPYLDRAQFPSTSYHGGGRITGGLYTGDCNGNLIEDSTELDGTTDADSNGILDVCENGLVDLPGTAGEPLYPYRLAGMGAGYSQFSATANCLGVGLDLGSVTPAWAAPGQVIGIGIKPVAEGQIDMTGLPPGTYKLVLTVPENANNVVPPLFVPGDPGGFAVEAEQVIGDEVLFYYDFHPDPLPVTPVAWKSIGVHGPCGELAIDLDPTDTAATTEPRMCGLEKLAVVFDGDLYEALYQPGGVAITGPGLTLVAESIATTNSLNDTLVLTLAGKIDRTCYTIDVNNVCVLSPYADPTCNVATLIGDVNNNQCVNTIDVTMIKASMGMPPCSRPRADLNCSGTVNTIDMALAKSRIILPSCITCP